MGGNTENDILSLKDVKFMTKFLEVSLRLDLTLTSSAKLSGSSTTKHLPHFKKKERTTITDAEALRLEIRKDMRFKQQTVLQIKGSKLHWAFFAGINQKAMAEKPAENLLYERESLGTANGDRREDNFMPSIETTEDLLRISRGRRRR